MLDHLDDPQPFIPDPDLRRKVGQRSRQLRRRHRLARSAAVLVVVAGLLGTIGLYVERRDAAIDRVDIATVPSTDGAVNVLLIGTDARPGTQDVRADAIVVVRFQIDGTVRMVPIPRDVWDEAKQARLAESRRSGSRAVIESVTSLTGVPIDHYVELEMEGLVRLVDAVGGVRLTPLFPLRDELSGLDLAEPSCQRLDGRSTLALLRARHLEFRTPQGQWRVEGSGDLGRTLRGQAVLTIAIAKLTERGSDPVTVDRLTRLLADHAVLDQGLSLRVLADLARRLGVAGPTRVSSDRLPVVAENRGGAEVLVLSAGADSVLQRYGAPEGEPARPDQGPVAWTIPVIQSC